MSDFAPVDDQSPVPMAPMPELPAIAADISADEIEEEKRAQPYWHPAWAEVQKIMEDAIAEYSANNALVYKDLPADEFKIRMCSEDAVAVILKNIMEDVKRAVESVEHRPKPAKRPRSGA